PERIAALEAIARFARSREPEPAALQLGRNGPWLVARAAVASLRSLDPLRYLGPARTWATIAPLVLDRHPKGPDAPDVESIVSQSCENVALPRPARVVLYKHSTVSGAPSARRSTPSPAWTAWTFPRSPSGPSPLANRPLAHAVLQFERPVRGPVIVGAG